MPEDKYYVNLNFKASDSYAASVSRIIQIQAECEEHKNAAYYGFFGSLSRFVLKLGKLEEELSGSYFLNNSFDELNNINHELYHDVMEEGYKRSYSNPQYSVSVFGEGIGRLLAYFHSKVRGYIDLAYRHKVYKMQEYNEWLIQAYECAVAGKMQYPELKEIIRQMEIKNIERDRKIFFIEDNDPGYAFLNDISLNCDLNDLRYLFRYGRYVSENEIAIARLLQEYEDETIAALADTVVNAFLRGFITHGKSRKARDIVRIIHVIGQERITAHIIRQLEKNNLRPVVVSTYSTEICRQFDYDHRFDSSIFASYEYFEMLEKCCEKAAEDCKDILQRVAGNIITLQFGQKQKKIGNTTSAILPAEEQSALMRGHNVNIRKIIERYIPRYETSYTGIAFPSPRIGSGFREIYKSIWDINMMDSSEYMKIQQTIIDALDRAEYVHVKGRGDNLTDIRIRIHELDYPEKETAFENCGADVNIPVGEVYTSPVLYGTDGLVHVKEVMIRDIKYQDLMLMFKNGYIDGYSCNNFDDMDENKKLIEENLLCLYKTLPMGEFAIGTNTAAYVAAEKYGIIDDLHTLIVEKMGPHFAVGDTCFVWQEDHQSYNIINNKRMAAKENEKTAKRKTNFAEAYTNTHSDITLPYDSIGMITAVARDGGRLEIIRNGRFVLEGTERLNEPFNR